jgi:hypothetical protein
MQNLCSSQNALFQGTKVVKHPFQSIGPKMMCASVSDDFANLPHVKRCKACVSGLNAQFWGTKVVNIHYSPLEPKNDVRECFGAYH